MIPPFHACERDPLFRLQGIDLSLLGAASLYLAGGPSATVGHLPLALLADEWLGSGTLRNSFYVEPWRQLSRARDLWLRVHAQGSLRVRVMRASPGVSAEVLREFRMDAAEPIAQAHLIGDLGDMPPGSRLFWHIDAVDGAVLHDVSWCTRSRPRADMRMAVLLRTWGRSDALASLLQQLAAAASADAHHAQWLNHLEFWVLDTTPEAAATWAGAGERLNLDLHLWTGPNLGGGGNASHLLSLFLQAHEQGQTQADEVLILDDDLNVSMESLARYAALCSYRSRDVICSLPVLMKSRPTQVWEDGGFWGRRSFDDPGNGQRERGLGPHLVRHGLKLDDFAHLDDFGPLNHCEYATFIFFGLPLRVLRQIGLPAAFFLRGDDVEFSIRAGAQGIPVITNPNLAAWHEPAHSHAQEFLAILHGVLINLTYSDDGAEAYAAWFEQRMLEHASLGDTAGLAVYQLVLEDLLNTQSPLLTPQFESHYPPRLSHWRNLRHTPMPGEARERLSRDPKVRLLPFLYPGVHPLESRPGVRVLLQDANAQGYWPLSPSTATERARMMSEFSTLVQRLSTEFAGVQRHWRQRLAECSLASFWHQVAERHRHATRLQWRHHRRPVLTDPASPAQPRPALPASAPARELRERLERELAAISQLRRHVLEQPRTGATALPGSGPTHRPWLHRLWPARTGRNTSPRGATASLAELPPDFDPQLYLSLHLDVARTGMDPVRHYLQFGHKEGRRYRL